MRPQESSWEWPADVPKATAAGGEDEWVEKYDESSGYYYYYNRTTKETSWDKPEKFKPATRGGGEWASKVDKDSGKTYYYNKTTKESAWEKPEGFVGSYTHTSERCASIVLRIKSIAHQGLCLGVVLSRPCPYSELYSCPPCSHRLPPPLFSHVYVPFRSQRGRRRCRPGRR